MIFQSKLKSELKAADAVLVRREKIASAIAGEVSKLSEAVRRRVEAERALQEARASALLGDAGETPESAQERVSKALAEIETLGHSLAGLRTAAAKLAPALIGSLEAISDELPGHNAQVEADFCREWQAGVAAFSALLGRRAALERVTGRKLQLPEPKATSVSMDDAALRDIARPHQTAATLRGLVANLGSGGGYDLQDDPNGVLRPFFAGKVYELLRPAQDSCGPELPAGELVVEQTFEPGLLTHYASIGYAVPYVGEDAQATPHAARQALVRVAERERQHRQELESELNRQGHGSSGAVSVLTSTSAPTALAG